MPEIDNLQIKATGDVSSATKGLDNLINTLNRVKSACSAVNSAFSGINTSTNTANSGVEKLNSALNKINSTLSNVISTVKNASSAFSSLANNCNSINTSGATNGLARLDGALAETQNSLNATNNAANTNVYNVLNQNISNLIMVLNQLVQVNVNVSNSFNTTNNTVTNNIHQINNYTNANERLNQSTRRATQSNRSLLRTLGTNIGSLYVLYMATKKVANVFADWFNESNDYIETLNLFNVTMRDTAESAYKYADSVQRIMGIDISEWMNYQGTFQQLAKGFGVVSEQADVMSQNLTQLSYDLASFFNVDVEKAFDKLSAAMTGQVKGLRQFGIDTTVASLQEYALAKGIEVSVKEMTQAQKSVLRYNYILEKSIDIQGDMARTIATPANAMRILNAQITQLDRALGNIVSCLVVEAIPYIQAFVMLIRDAANALAEFLGFELPEIDYSDLDDAVSVVDDVSDSVSDTSSELEEATESAKKLKKQLMGFDELNILSSNIDDSTSKKDDTGNNLPSDLGLGIPEYDFGLDKVSSQAEEIYQNMKEFFGNIAGLWDDFEGTIRRVAEILAGIWAISKIMKFVSWIKTSTSVLAKLLKKTKLFKALDTLFPNILSGFASGWALAAKNGEGFFGKLKSGIAGARSNLSFLQKGIITVATTLVAGFSGYNFFYDLASGTMTWYNALIDITLAASAIGVAFALTGPIGGLITVLGLVAGAFLGLEQAVQESMETAVNEAFYDGLGTSITTLSDSFSGVMTKIQETYDKYNETFSDMAENKTDIENVSNNIGLISSAMNNGVTDVQTGCTDILEAITQLKTDTKTQCDLIYQSIYTACSGSFKDALEEAGISTDALLKLTALTASNMNQDAADILQQMTDITNSYKDGKITQEEYTEKLSFLQGKYNDIMGITDEATQATSNFADSLERLNDIDWQNETQRNEAFSKIKDSASGAKDSINEYYDNLKDNITQLRNKYDKGSDEWNLYNKALGATESARSEALDNVNTQVNEFFSKVQENLITEMGNMQDEIDEKWDNLNFWEKLYWGDDKEGFTKKFLEDYSNNIVKPIDQNIQSCMDDIGTKGETYADEAIDGIISRLTVWKDGSWKFDYSEFDNALKKEMHTIGENSLAGYDEGAKEKADEITKTFSGMPDNFQGAFKTADNQHSPSKDWYGFGENSIQGYINGVVVMIPLVIITIKQMVEKSHNAVKQAQNGKYKALAKEAVTEYANGFNSNFYTIQNSWDSKINSLSRSLDNLFSVNEWKQRAINASNALRNNLYFPNVGLDVTFNNQISGDQKKVMQALGLSGFPQFNWYTYANGGFPSIGEMFIAREKGPEFVGRINNKTSVANNDQIVEGITAGVYKGVAAAMQGYNNGGSPKITCIVQVEKETIGKASVEYHNEQVLRTGESPLLI